MSTCVNLNLKEFKDCCKRLNVSPTTLEPIVHEYINIEGNENSFPSDDYISERIHGREVSVLSDAQIKVWERKFSEPKTFNSNEEAVAYYNEAKKFFPKDAIGFKETRDGRFEVRIAEPFNETEIEAIKKKAIADGTFKKVFNKKLNEWVDSNLDERQWLHVRTKAFKDWFGDWENDPENASKVVDENGEPLVVYHGTDVTFNEFDPSKQDGEHKAFYFTDSQDMAKSYRGGKILMPVFLNIKDSYNIDAKGKNWNSIDLNIASNAKNPIEFAELILKQQQVEIETAKRGYYNTFWGEFIKNENYTNEKIKNIVNQHLPKIYKRYLELQNEHSKNPIKNIKRILEMRSIIKTISNIYNDAYLRNSYSTTYETVATRDLDLVLNDKEGILIQNVKDYGSKVENFIPHDVYIVYDPNQIKSADLNEGTYSLKDNNIYHNKTLSTKTSVLDVLASKHPYTWYGSKRGQQGDPLLKKVGDTYFLSYDKPKGKTPPALSKETALEGLASELKKLGLDPDYIGVTDTGIVYEKTRKYPIEDRIEAYKESEDLFESREQQEQALSVLDFLSEKTGLRYKFISKEEAKKLLKRELNPNENAFVGGNTAYFIKDRRFNTDIASEEMLHPFVNSILLSNKEAFNSLLEDARKSFPKLAIQIEESYKDRNETERQEELVTQALSRAFRKDFEENPNHNSIKDLIRKFFEAIVGWFRNNKDLPWFDKEGNVIDKIYAQDLSQTITLENLAKIINTEIQLGNANFINSGRFNISSETQKSTLAQEELKESIKEFQESLGITEEEAREIAEQYDDDSTEEELIQKQQSEEEDKIRKHILSIDAQIKELTESNVISRSEITELAYDIVYTVSDFLTQWQNDPKLIIEKFNKDEKDIEKIKTMSRKELANYIGINNIFDFIKEAYFGEIKPTDSDEIIEKKEIIYDNFEAILQFGKSAFNTIEDFSIGYSEVGYNTKDKSENDNESELTNEEQTAKEELGDKQEHWQIDSRTIDNFLSMSQTVKRELLNLYELEEVVKDGISVIQPKLNAFGMKKRVSPKDATSSILRWTRGALTLKQMIVKLQEKEDKHPWVKELITKLSDDNKTGKYTDFQSQFFNVFCKHFQDYYAVTKETNKDGTTITKVIPLNLNPALKGAVDAIKILYQVRRHPLFDKSGKVDDIALNTLKKYKELLEKITDKPFEEIDLDRVKTGIFKISQLLGFSTTEKEISQILSTNNIKTFIKNLDNIVDNLEKGAKLQNYSPFDFKGTNSISGYIREFIRPITERREDTAISSLYDSGKMYQSYVIPSWLSKTMDKFMNLEGEEYERFLMEEYGQYDWFRDTSVEDVTDTTAWRCPWLKRLANASLEERRKIFGHHVQLNYLGHNYMKNMSGPEYTLSVINEFFTDTTDSKESIGTAWYKIPMMSNKPSAEFIKFIRYKGLTYKNDITKELVNVYIQELMRIQTVIQRGYTKNDPEFIKAFDNRGKHFLFLDYLDEYLNGSKKNQELGKLLNAKVLGKKLPDATITVKGETKIISGEQRLLDLVKNEIKTQMDAKVASIIESYKDNGIFEAAKNVQGVSKTDEELTRDLENFIWNDTFASINILQMTITDLAYYKDTEDVQKRLAQIHAPGMRPNVEATDYEGNRVCPDGMFRTAFLKDFEGKAVFELDEIIQNVIDNIEVVFQRKIDVAKSNNNKTEEEYWTSTMNFIIDQLKETVNVADAQAFNCPTSYRKKALMFGKWDKKYEEVYQKLKNKEYNINDLEAAFQPLKPFVYTSTSKDSGVTNAPIKNMKVGMQFKNSEYLLIMADAILRGEDTGKPNLLRAIFDVMEESAKKHPGKGIDSIMFGSAVKAGLHGQIDIADSMTEEEAKSRLEVIFDSNSKDGMYNPTFVHTYPAEDYTIQQEVPAHFMDHDQAHGTQERMIIPSDLPSVDENGNEVFFEYYDYKEGKVVKKNAKEFRRVYEENIAESINQNLEELEDALGLNIVGPDAKRQRNIKLSKILQEEILSSPRYGIDLYVACSVNEKGEFNIPLGDPVQSKRVEQLINSVIKNRLNKQKIAGGPVVQVSNFGMSKRLSIKFKKEDGTILPTFKEWQAENENGTIEEYKEMLKKEQAGIAHYECYAPAYMKEMFECFMNEKGELDVEAMEESNPEMLEMVGYRIPSEDAYSVAPLKIVGFLPKEAGEGIVMPYEITLITGSDRIVVSTSII